MPGPCLIRAPRLEDPPQARITRLVEISGVVLPCLPTHELKRFPVRSGKEFLKSGDSRSVLLSLSILRETGWPWHCANRTSNIFFPQLTLVVQICVGEANEKRRKSNLPSSKLPGSGHVSEFLRWTLIAVCLQGGCKNARAPGTDEQAQNQ